MRQHRQGLVRTLGIAAIVIVTATLAACVPNVGAHGGQNAGRAMLNLELGPRGVIDAQYVMTATASPGEGGLGSGTSSSTGFDTSTVTLP